MRRTIVSKRGRNRTIPTPPSLRRAPAKIIEPKVGASTCAIGNQKCRPYTGNLTANAINTTKVNNQEKVLEET